VLGKFPGVALVPRSVTRETPDGLVAVQLKEPVERVETDIVWRKDDRSAAGTSFRGVARTVFGAEHLKPSTSGSPHG
jgi:DNA-binding transcriptional LysR family regulator